MTYRNGVRIAHHHNIIIADTIFYCVPVMGKRNFIDNIVGTTVNNFFISKALTLLSTVELFSIILFEVVLNIRLCDLSSCDSTISRYKFGIQFKKSYHKFYSSLPEILKQDDKLSAIYINKDSPLYAELIETITIFKQKFYYKKDWNHNFNTYTF